LKSVIDGLDKTVTDLTLQNKNLMLNSHNTDMMNNNDIRILNNIKSKSLLDSKSSSMGQSIALLNPNMSINELEKQIVGVEYLKNILLKYLEAIAVGNEFQTKILENVIFAILSIPNSEKVKLEEKRARSYFYYNLWYNAKAFLSAKIYGNNVTLPITPIEKDNNMKQNMESEEKNRKSSTSSIDVNEVLK